MNMENVLPPASASQIPPAPGAATIHSEVIKKPSLSPESVKVLQEQEKLNNATSKVPVNTKVPDLSSPPKKEWKAKQKTTSAEPAKNTSNLSPPAGERPGLIAPGG